MKIFSRRPQHCPTPTDYCPHVHPSDGYTSRRAFSIAYERRSLARCDVFFSPSRSSCLFYSRYALRARTIYYNRKLYWKSTFWKLKWNRFNFCYPFFANLIIAFFSWESAIIASVANYRKNEREKEYVNIPSPIGTEPSDVFTLLLLLLSSLALSLRVLLTAWYY